MPTWADVHDGDLGAIEASSPTAHTSGSEDQRSAMHPVVFALVLIAFAGFQTISYTAFRLAEFEGFSVNSLIPLLKDAYFWLGVLSSFGVLVISFTLVRVSESSLVLVMSLYMASIIVGFILLPLTWRFVFHEEIFSSGGRVAAFAFALAAAMLLLDAKYFWDRGG
jgi:hypothetical protein